MSDLSGLTAGAASYTAEHTFVRGEYALGDERVPYFAISMRVTDAVRDLTLARDLIFDPAEPVHLDELFQRDLDTNRANDEIKGYLRHPNRIKFFNSFTVVLMPVARGDRPVPMPGYPEDDPSAPPVSANDAMAVHQIGPVRLQELVASPEVGRISWNREEVRAVIIDGQHRFYALKQLFDDEAHRVQLRPDTTRIPVLVLVLDERAGFVGATGAPSDVLRTCRTIFIDLNKNAESVSRTRQYLMDDRDLTAVSMRAIVSDQMGGDGSGNGSDGPARIPLALVDWYSEQAKFDSGLHITTVVTLHDIVASTLDRRPPEHPTDYDAWRVYLSELRARVGDEGLDDWDTREAAQRLSRAELAGTPFSLMEEEVAAVGLRFSQSLGQLVVRPLLEVAPYRALADSYRAAGLLEGPLELWLGHDPAGKKAFERLTGELPGVDAERRAAEAKARAPMAYQVVFQKAVISCAVILDGARDEFAEAFSLDSSITREVFVTGWRDRFDERVSPLLADDAFWRGTGIDFNGTVNYARPAVGAIAGLMSLCLLCPVTNIDDSEEPRGNTETQVVAILQRGEDTIGPLLNDPLRTDASVGELVGYARWLKDQMASIRRGPMRGAAAATRTAAGGYRQQVRKYLEAEARSLDLELANDVRDAAVLAHGAKRMAVVAATAHAS